MRKRKPKSLYDMMMDDFFYEDFYYKDNDVEKIIRDAFDDYNIFFRKAVVQPVFRLDSIYFMSLN